jgi:hypothetical protein
LVGQLPDLKNGAEEATDHSRQLLSVFARYCFLVPRFNPKVEEKQCFLIATYPTQIFFLSTIPPCSSLEITKKHAPTIADVPENAQVAANP